MSLFDIGGPGGSFRDRFGSLFTEDQKRLAEYAENDMAQVRGAGEKRIAETSGRIAKNKDQALEAVGVKPVHTAESIEDSFSAKSGADLKARAIKV